MRDMATVPQVTYALIAINVIVFLAEGRAQFTLARASDDSLRERCSRQASAAAGAGRRRTAQYWRLVTRGFLHENLLHIGFNMYVLYYLGMMLEPALGRVRFARDLRRRRCSRGSFGALLVSPHVADRRRLGRDLRPDGRRRVELRARQIP